jgi:hypothetical protein
MSSYIAIIGMLLLVLLPLVIPTVITIVHALENLRRNDRVINRGAICAIRCARLREARARTVGKVTVDGRSGGAQHLRDVGSRDALVPETA